MLEVNATHASFRPFFITPIQLSKDYLLVEPSIDSFVLCTGT